MMITLPKKDYLDYFFVRTGVVKQQSLFSFVNYQGRIMDFNFVINTLKQKLGLNLSEVEIHATLKIEETISCH